MLTKLELHLDRNAMKMLNDLAKNNRTSAAEEAELILHLRAQRTAREIEPVPKRRVRSKLGGL